MKGPGSGILNRNKREGEEHDIEDLYEYVDRPEEEKEDDGAEAAVAGGDEWEWTLTNIGAVIVMAALVLAVMTAGVMILYAVIYTFIAIPVLVLLLIGYALVIKDHLDKKRKRGKVRRGGRSRRRRKGEEE